MLVQELVKIVGEGVATMGFLGIFVINYYSIEFDVDNESLTTGYILFLWCRFGGPKRLLVFELVFLRSVFSINR